MDAECHHRRPHFSLGKEKGGILSQKRAKKSRRSALSIMNSGFEFDFTVRQMREWGWSEREIRRATQLSCDKLDERDARRNNASDGPKDEQSLVNPAPSGNVIL